MVFIQTNDQNNECFNKIGIVWHRHGVRHVLLLASHIQPTLWSMSLSFTMLSENLSIFPDVSPSSPTTAFTALQSLPLSPPEDIKQLCVDASGPLSPTLYRLNAATTTAPPVWASQLWDVVPTAPPAGAPMAAAPLSQNNFMTQRRWLPLRRGTPVSQLFQSSSTLSMSQARGHCHCWCPRKHGRTRRGGPSLSGITTTGTGRCGRSSGLSRTRTNLIWGARNNRRS